MDPASLFALVAACASLAANCAKTAMALRSLAETYKTAELSILTLVEECATVQFAWREIETWMHQNNHHIGEHQDVVERLARSVYVGQLTMSALEDDIRKAIPKQGAFRRRASFTFITSLIQEHQGRIRGQVSALQLLLQAMSMPKLKDRNEVLTVNELAFREVGESVLSIIPSHLSSRYSVITDNIANNQDNDAMQYIPFSFDNDLFTSIAYSRSYRPISQATKAFNYSPRSQSHKHRLGTKATRLERANLPDPMEKELSSQGGVTTESPIDEEPLAQIELVSKHITQRLEAVGFL